MFKENIKNAKTLIFSVTGGIGRNIFATAVIRNLRNTYPDKKIFVVAGFPEIFFNNPHVDRVYGFSSLQHLYDDYIDGRKDTVLIEVEPYRHPEYIAGNEHIIKCWCDMLEIECDSVKPELYLTKSELDMAEAYVKKFEKPLILFQHTGGKAPDSQDKANQIASTTAMYRRNLREDTIQKIVDKLTEDGYTVGSVQTPNQFQPKNSEKISFPLRAVIALIPHCYGVISIDSFLMHAAAAFDKKSLVCWAGTSPEKLGYEMHTNLRQKKCRTPECHRPNSYAYDVQPNGTIWDCPYKDICTDYDAELILTTFKQLKGELYESDVKNYVKPEVLLSKQVIHKCGSH